ncbi:tetratricopeptide repeat protein [Methyloceanibacter sp.]|jgi:tetratricopeptide (TPR) repeat protein|uniref:tetratricopeptide repeat protein n=1 Tax=Methyloceanibacter sp. TaxID=1965321 RepID=UPI003C79288C
MRNRPDRVSYAVATTNDLAARIWSSSATQQSFAIADELAANPNSIRWKRDITINDVDSGDFDESSGALAIYEESLTLRRRLAEIDPRNNQWRRDAAYFLDRIGDEYRKVGMRERAIAAYEESLAVWRHLANIDRRNPQLQLNISECQDKLGDLKLGAADGMGALAAYEESLTIRRHLSKDTPSNPSRQLNVAGSLEKIGDLKLAAGDAQGALTAYREMLSIDRVLVAIDGSNSEWQRNLSLSLERFGDVTLAVGNTVAAVAAYEQTVALRRRLAASDKTNIQWQKEVSASLEKISRLKRWAEDNIELQRDLSATSERLENTSLSAGTLLRKLSSIPKLIAATRRQRNLRIGLASVGKLSTQVRACVQGFQRSAAIFRKLGISSAIFGKLSAQVRACVRGLQRSVEVKGLKLKWLFPAPSRPRRGRVLIPNQNEPIAAEAQHEGSTHGQSDVLAPIGKENTANNSLTSSPSSTLDEPNDATSVEASMMTGGRASKMDIQPQVTKSPVKARSGKRRRRKRKPSPRLPANQKKGDMVRARMN